MSFSSPQRLVIATRESRLALWQANYVCDRLRIHYPDCAVSLLGMTTRGDKILDRPLNAIGGKGLFVKELEMALQDGRADLAVHSLKDVPMQLPAGFALAAIPAREDARDAFVSTRYQNLEDLPPGSVVGTSSLRREAQLRAQYPYLAISPLRGNLDTRLRKLDAGEFDAIILAAAGLKRLGLAARIRAYLPVERLLPAAGQGALGLEIATNRSDADALRAWLAPLHDPATAACVQAERALAAALQGSCQVPLASYAVTTESGLWLRALIAHPDGQEVLRAQGQGPEPQALAHRVTQDLQAQGAAALLAALAAHGH